jgi:hypothetical protein
MHVSGQVADRRQARIGGLPWRELFNDRAQRGLDDDRVAAWDVAGPACAKRQEPCVDPSVNPPARSPPTPNASISPSLSEGAA